MTGFRYPTACCRYESRPRPGPVELQGPNAMKRTRSRFSRQLLDKLRRDPHIPGLVARGLTIGKNVGVGRDVYLAEVCPWLLTIADDVTLGMHVTILTHDSSTKLRVGYTAVSPVVICRRAYVGAFSIVLLGVTIGQDAIVGAGSVVRSDIPDGAVAAGVPARVVGSAEEFEIKNQARLRESPKYDSVWALEGTGGAVPTELIKQMRADLAGGKIGFIL